MSVKERLKEFISYKKLSQAKFEKAVGLSNGYINNIRQSITPEKLQSILAVYPELNSGWVLTGEGFMIRPDNKEVINVLLETYFPNGYHIPLQIQPQDWIRLSGLFNELMKNDPDFKSFDVESFKKYVTEYHKSIPPLPEEYENAFGIDGDAEAIPSEEDSDSSEVYISKNGIEFKDLGDGRLLMTMPLVDQSASAGYMESWADPQYIDELPKHTIIREKRHRGFYRAFKVKGDSMDNGLKDAICNGDIVAGRKIEKQYWTSKLHIDTYEVFVIIHQTQGIAVKTIFEHDVKNGKIICRSKNPDRQAYPDFTLDLNEVMEIYNVVSIERKL